jgi:hypothetical protein
VSLYRVSHCPIAVLNVSILGVFMLNVIVLNVIRFSVAMLNDVLPPVKFKKCQLSHFQRGNAKMAKKEMKKTKSSDFFASQRPKVNEILNP